MIRSQRSQRSYIKIYLTTRMAANRIFSIFSRSSRSRQSFHEFKYRLFTLATWIPAVIFFNENIGELATINGPSMYPYLNTSFNEDLTRDVCWVNKWNPTRKLERGMIVWFRWVWETLTLWKNLFTNPKFAEAQVILKLLLWSVS